MNPAGPFRIIHQDSSFLVVHKPQGIHVHPSPMSPREPAMLQALRDQMGSWVYPVHRLDRPTSGLVVFALDPATTALIQADMEASRVRKTYHAIVRGWFPESLVINRPLADEGNGTLRPSLTRATLVQRFQVDQPVGNFPTARFSLVRLEPETGRFHQLRRHLAGVGHPIVYDTGHGDRHTNHFVDRVFGLRQLQLFATDLHMPHPHHRGPLDFHDPVREPENRFLAILEALT